MPPAPIGARISYGPRRSPAAIGMALLFTNCISGFNRVREMASLGPLPLVAVSSSEHVDTFLNRTRQQAPRRPFYGSEANSSKAQSRESDEGYSFTANARQPK